MNNFSKEFFRFLIIGFIALFLDLAIYWLLFSVVSIFMAKLISYVIATFFTFLGNKFWSFKRSGFFGFQIFSFLGLYVISSLINANVNKYAFVLLNQKLTAFLIATGVCLFFNFIGLKFLVFKKN
jgi:putative flippase GtrA